MMFGLESSTNLLTYWRSMSAKANKSRGKAKAKRPVEKQTAMQLAIEALDRIALHEKECGERWGEAIVELRELRKVTDAHSARWEKLAWLVIATVLTTAGATLVANII